MSDPSPYNAQTEGTPPPKKSNMWLWVLIGVLGGGFLLSLLCCGGVGMLGFFGMKVAGEQVANQIRNEPEIIEHLGDVESVSMDFAETAAENQQNVVIYKVKGSKATGSLLVTEQTSEGVKAAKLRLPDGSEIEVLP